MSEVASRTVVTGVGKFFFTLLRTGCRLGEAIALQPGDIDFRGKFINIRRNFPDGDLTTSKNHKPRRVDMSDRLVQVLKDHLVTQEPDALAKDQHRREWLFTNQSGDRLDPDNVRSVCSIRCLARLSCVAFASMTSDIATRRVS